VRAIAFGKHRGETFAAVAGTDPAYLNWLALNHSDPRVRDAAARALSDRGAAWEPPARPQPARRR